VPDAEQGLLVQGIARRLIRLEGPSGRLWGLFEPATLTIEFRHGRTVEHVDLRPYLSEPTSHAAFAEQLTDRVE